jgi:hypothetical protein
MKTFIKNIALWLKTHKIAAVAIGCAVIVAVTLAVTLPLVLDKNTDSYDYSRDKFTDYGFSGIEIRQNSIASYDFSVNLPAGAENAEFYFTKRDRITESDIPLVHTGAAPYIMTVEHGPGDYFLWAVTPDGQAVMAITIPKMEPYVNPDTERDITQIFFKTDPKSSWSSFIDPEGKNVYRSASPVFSLISAEAVATKVNILAESVTDNAPNASKPYYFIAFNSKNGAVKFISYPLLYQSIAFSITSAEFDGSGGESLNVYGQKTPALASLDYRMLVRSGTEEFYAENVASEQNAFDFQFDLTRLTKTEVWYDLVMIEIGSGRRFDLIMSADGSLLGESRRYRFEKWNGLLKVAFSPYTDDFTVNAFMLTDSGGSPALRIEGTSSVYAANELTLIVEYETSGIAHTLPTVAAVGADGMFAFEFDLTQMARTDIWHSIYISAGGIRYQILTAPNPNYLPNGSVTADGRTYTLREYGGYLKLNAALAA